MKYAFIAEHATQYSVARLCEVLEVGRSGYYAWRSRPESARAQANRELCQHIHNAFLLNRQVYGSPRMYHALLEEGRGCGRHRVARLMRQEHLVAKRARKRRPRTTCQAAGARVAPNLLNRDFTAQGPNQKWVADITYIPTQEGWLYLASILDVYSRRVVGWAMDVHMETDLVERAWQMAVQQRHPAPGLLSHTDRGSQYTSDSYWQALEVAHCQVSMSRTGNCWDNAVMESFHASLKGECADHSFATRQEARSAVFEYIEVWYNRQRIHSSLGYLSPLEFEQSSGH